MSLNILQCDQACTDCIKSYKKKHDLQPGDKFKVPCSGIPKEYVTNAMSETMGGEDLREALAMLDPVTWAADILDWHCSDPVGDIWKRKTAENSLGEVTPYKDEYEELIKQGKSAFNRPYQKVMLRCSSKRKVFRLGRQSGKTETLCVAILHALFTNNDFRVVVITPYQTQIELIFNRLAKMIRESNTVKSSIHRYVKAPNYTIELKNGSTVRGFTAGTKSGGNADAVRGQKANMLVLDEADYLSAEDIGSALAIITNYPDATTWMSSTPTGKREKFYDACHSVLWKEYHFPSMVNPLWGPELEEHFRNEYTEIQYSHEVLATFGEQEQGVFQAAFIDDARTDYRYEDRKLEGWVYSIGVDWNDQKIGTTMAVVGYNPSNNYFRVFNRYVVSRDGWTQHAAIEKIIELNRYWLPKSIYIDKGYGHAQYEIIRKYGLDSLSDVHKGHGHPDSRLQKITKQFDFGSKLTIKDPFTKQDVDKAAKPFLVENAVRRFEQRVIQFSKYDTQLESELRGYIIDHTTISGSPVYKQGNEKVGDHNLDALNLALIAFTLEGSQFGKVNYETHIAFSPTSIGQKTGIAPLPGRPSEAPQTNHEKNMPSMNRTSVIENKPVGFGNTPAANMNDGQRKLWSWPGFERDAPRPMRRMPGGMSGGRSGPPTRKKI